MAGLRKVTKVRLSIWLAAMLLSLLANAAYAACYSNIQIVYQDGTEQTCAVFCTFPGGWLCKPMS